MMIPSSAVEPGEVRRPRSLGTAVDDDDPLLGTMIPGAKHLRAREPRSDGGVGRRGCRVDDRERRSRAIDHRRACAGAIGSRIARQGPHHRFPHPHPHLPGGRPHRELPESSSGLAVASASSAISPTDSLYGDHGRYGVGGALSVGAVGASAISGCASVGAPGSTRCWSVIGSAVASGRLPEDLPASAAGSASVDSWVPGVG